MTTQQLPTLVGSEKQISWASQIRDTALTECFTPRINLLTTAVDKLKRRDGVKPELTDEFIGNMIAKTEERIGKIIVLTHTKSASWWIENRYSFLDLISAIK